MGCGGSKDEKQKKAPDAEAEKSAAKQAPKSSTAPAADAADHKSAHESATPEAEPRGATPKSSETAAAVRRADGEFSPVDALDTELDDAPEETTDATPAAAAAAASTETQLPEAAVAPLSPEAVAAEEAQDRAVIEVEASEAMGRTQIASEAVTTSPAPAHAARTPRAGTPRRASVSTPRGVTAQPRTLTVKQRPGAAKKATVVPPPTTTATAAAPRAATTASSTTTAGPGGETAVPSITITAVRSMRNEDGEEVLVPLEDEGAAADATRAAPEAMDPETGKLIEQKQADPTWQVLRPPPQNHSSWQLLRQVRLVFNMRNITAI